MGAAAWKAIGGSVVECGQVDTHTRRGKRLFNQQVALDG